nr:hypothetical protein [uncultured Mediterranean phage uvMED]
MSIVKLNNQAVKNATSFGSISSLGSMTLIKKLTASSSATLSFVDGSDGVVLDDTYKEYVFTFNNIHPQNNGTFDFNFSIDSGSNYNVTKTSTAFRSIHSESDSTSFGYRTAVDLAQSTSFQQLHNNVGNDSDQTVVGEMRLFNPSSTTFVKHFLTRMQSYSADDYSQDYFIAGYGNTTSAVDGIRFQMNTGNIDAGDICLYGIA